MLQRLLTKASMSELPQEIDVLILGAGVGGGYVCKHLVEATTKEKGKRRSVAVIGEEPFLPYERPALSKARLHGPGQKIRARLPGFNTCKGSGWDAQNEDFYKINGIQMMTRCQAVKVDVKGTILEVKNLESGVVEKLKYKTLIVATGCRARELNASEVPGADLGNILTLRSEMDMVRLDTGLEGILASGSKDGVVIIGAGFIGLETSAGILSWGIPVTLIDFTKHVVSNIFPPEIAARYEAELVNRGVTLHMEQRIAEFIPSASDSSRVGAIKLANGTVIKCSLVVVGIGAIPNTELFEGQLEFGPNGGILVDENLQTSALNVFAIGDIATFPSKTHSIRRLEHVDNVRKMAAHVVRTAVLKDTSVPFQNETPYFYSRNFEYSPEPWVFQMYGNNFIKGVVMEPIFFDGDKPNSFGCFWVSKGVIQGALLVNGAKEGYDALKEIVQLRKTPSSLKILSNKGKEWKSLL